MALHSLYCADVPLRNCSLTHSREHSIGQCRAFIDNQLFLSFFVWLIRIHTGNVIHCKTQIMFRISGTLLACDRARLSPWLAQWKYGARGLIFWNCAAHPLLQPGIFPAPSYVWAGHSIGFSLSCWSVLIMASDTFSLVQLWHLMYSNSRSTTWPLRMYLTTKPNCSQFDTSVTSSAWMPWKPPPSVICWMITLCTCCFMHSTHCEMIRHTCSCLLTPTL